MCEVFFLGTARRIDSQIPSNKRGTWSWIAEGMARAKDGRSGRESCREYRVVNVEVFEIVRLDNRGRKDDRIDRVLTWAELMSTDNRSWEA